MDKRKAEHPKYKLFNLRMNEIELKQLEECANWLHISKSQVLILGLHQKHKEYRSWKRKREQHIRNTSSEQAYMEWCIKNGLE